MSGNYFKAAGNLDDGRTNENVAPNGNMPYESVANGITDTTVNMVEGARYCVFCGAEMSGSMRFCPSCGQESRRSSETGGYSYQPAPPQTTGSEVNQSFPQRIDNLASSISRKKRIKAQISNNAGTGYGMPTNGGSYVVVKKKSTAKTLIVIGSVLAVVATIAAIVFFAMGGMLRARMSGKWYVKNRNGEIVETLRFGYWGKGSQELVYTPWDNTEFKWSLDKDKELVISTQGGIFGGYTSSFQWDIRAKNGDDDYWYLEDGILYFNGDVYTR